MNCHMSLISYFFQNIPLIRFWLLTLTFTGQLYVTLYLLLTWTPLRHQVMLEWIWIWNFNICYKILISFFTLKQNYFFHRQSMMGSSLQQRSMAPQIGRSASFSTHHPGPTNSIQAAPYARLIAAAPSSQQSKTSATGNQESSNDWIESMHIFWDS